jgi:hypothetical protein
MVIRVGKELRLHYLEKVAKHFLVSCKDTTSV